MGLRSIPTSCLTGSLLILAACTGAPIDFERMSVADLMTYNRSAGFWDQVYCADEVRSGSHIRRRHCDTLVDIRDGNANSAAAINVIGSSRIF